MGTYPLIAALIIKTFIEWIGLDVWLGPNGGLTESMVMRAWGQNSAFFAHLIGFICGHWFFNRPTVSYSAWGFGLLIWGLLIGWDLYWHAHGYPWVWYRYAGLWFATGIAAGSFLWGQQLP